MAQGGTTLKVSTQRQGDFILLEYNDDGPGMSEPDRVFDPFYTTRPVGQGTGLGLSACYGIIQEHTGSIVCQNRPEGGAQFQIKLPIFVQTGEPSSGTTIESAKAAALPPGA
jgi:two-component system, NtrC family, sensor kinase